MGFSRCPRVGTFGLIKRSNRLVSLKIRMSLAYTRNQRVKVVAFLVLYVDDILLIGNDVGMLSTIKVWLANTFDMKDLG